MQERGWIINGFIALIIGVIIEIFLFLLGHICQLISKGNTATCKLFIIPFTIFANFLPWNYRIDYVLVLLAFLLIIFVVGAIIGKIKGR